MKSKMLVNQSPSIILILLIYVMFLSISYPGVASSTPIVTSTHVDSFQNGKNVTLRGSGFGPGPNVILFDDFEKGKAGQTIMLGSGGATYGGWASSGNSSTTYYSNSSKVSGNLAFQADMKDNWYSFLQANLPSGTTDLFVSWWFYLPSGNNFPGYNSDRVNWKQMWIQGESTTDDDLVVPTALGNTPNVIKNWYVNGNESNPGYKEYVTVNFSRGSWKRLWVWLKGGSNNDGQFHFWELISSGVAQRKNDNNVNTLKAGGAFEKVRPNGYAAPAPSCHPTFDDIYIAAGANARARVELGNESSYMSCTKLAILTPISWKTDEIIATIRLGSFKSGESAYLFVIDADGGVSSGKSVTIGESASENPHDIDGEGNVNIADVVLCVNIILGIEDGDGDVNQDGETTILDVTAIVNEILGG